jgi:hypothetical protein
MLILGGFIAYLILLQDLINIDKKEAVELFNKKINDKNSDKKSNGFRFLFTKVSSIIYKIPGLMNIITLAAIFNLIYYVFLFYAITFPVMILLKIIYNLSIPDSKFK